MRLRWQRNGNYNISDVIQSGEYYIPLHVTVQALLHVPQVPMNKHVLISHKISENAHHVSMLTYSRKAHNNNATM